MKLEQLDNKGKPTGNIAVFDDQVATVMLNMKNSRWRVVSSAEASETKIKQK